jgi:hypothetical protein
MKKNWLLFFLVSFLTACISSGPTIGSVENTVNPPKLVKGVDGVVYWENIGSFGPMPKDLKGDFDKLCIAANPKWHAIGFNSKALDLEGKQFPNGGFICSP